MNENTSTAIWGSVAGLAVVAIVLGLSYFIWSGVHSAQLEGTKRMNTCVEHGGTWLDRYKDCIAPK